MIDKLLGSAADAVACIEDGATIAIGGFGGAGQPEDLIDALIEHGARELTLVSNNAGNGDVGIRSEEHTSELQSREKLVCRLLLEKKKTKGTEGGNRLRKDAEFRAH